MIITQFNTYIKVIRSDNRREYFKTKLIEFMNFKGILNQTICPYSPQQNGVAERKNRHILKVIRSLLIDDNVSSHLWGEVVSSALYLINRTPSSVINFQRPLDVLSVHCILPSMVSLPPHAFVFVIYVHLHPYQRTKLEERAFKCVFVGYRSTKKDYHAYHPPSKKFYISMDVTFNEHSFFMLILHFRVAMKVKCIIIMLVCLISQMKNYQRTKLEERAFKCVFVGYRSTKKDYCVDHPPSKKFYISMDVTFNEHSFFYVDSTLQGGNESEVHNHYVSMFDIPDKKLLCKDKLSCEDHYARSVPIVNIETSLLDNTMSSDPN